MTTPSPETASLLSLTTDTAPVLEQHRFNEANLERYMGEHILGFVPPLTVGQVRGGMSNPTFILSDGAGKRYVLRKKPPGKLLPSTQSDIVNLALLAPSEFNQPSDTFRELMLNTEFESPSPSML